MWIFYELCCEMCAKSTRGKWKIKVEILDAEKWRKSSDIINRYELDNPQLNKSWRENDDEKRRQRSPRTVGKFLCAEDFLCRFIDDDSNDKKVFVCAYVKLCCEMRKATCCEKDNAKIIIFGELLIDFDYFLRNLVLMALIYLFKFWMIEVEEVSFKNTEINFEKYYMGNIKLWRKVKKGGKWGFLRQNHGKK